jgi:Mrp family chromosome partitioning ATPase/capsular polysaccharide biosynthesis protein
VLRRQVALIVAIAILVPVAAVVATFFQEDRYVASATLLFRSAPLQQVDLFGTQPPDQSGSQNADREQATNLRLVTLPVVADLTARAVPGLGLTGADIRNSVSIQADGNSSLITISASTGDRIRSATLANAFAAQYIAFRKRSDSEQFLQARQMIDGLLARLPADQRNGPRGASLRSRSSNLTLAASLQGGNAQLVQRATPPSARSSPNVKQNALLGLAVGVLAALAIAALRDRLDQRIHATEEIERIYGRPILAAITTSSVLASKDPAAALARNDEAEAFQLLQANLRYFDLDAPLRTVVVSSAEPGDGKSTVSRHLAIAGARSGLRVLLVDADLRRPTQATFFRIDGGVGLSQVLAGLADLADAMANIPLQDNAVTFDSEEARELARGHGSLHVLGAGPASPNPQDLMESRRSRRFFEQVRGDFDLVVIDVPPPTVVSDSIPLLAHADGVLVVTRVHKTRRDSSSRLVQQLEASHSRVIGVVVNGVLRRTEGYGYSYSYQSNYKHDSESKRKTPSTS